PLAKSTQLAQVPQGTGVGPCSQFKQRAKMRADVVLPQPRGPENKYAWFTRFFSNAVIKGAVTCSCPMTSPNVSGRYLRYSAVLTPVPYRLRDAGGISCWTIFSGSTIHGSRGRVAGSKACSAACKLVLGKPNDSSKIATTLAGCRPCSVISSSVTAPSRLANRWPLEFNASGTCA